MQFVRDINHNTKTRSRQECAEILRTLVEKMNADYMLTPAAQVYVKATKQIISPHQMRILWPLKIYLKSPKQTLCASAVKIWLESGQHAIQPAEPDDDIFERTGSKVAQFLEAFLKEQPDNMFGDFIPRSTFRNLFKHNMNPKKFWMQVYNVIPDMRPRRRKTLKGQVMVWIPYRFHFKDSLDKFKVHLVGCKSLTF